MNLCSRCKTGLVIKTLTRLCWNCERLLRANDIIDKGAYLEITIRDSWMEACGTALIDKGDFQFFRSRSWTIGTGGYLRCSKGLFHRFVFGIKRGERQEVVVDHINGNRYDNRKANLRVVSPAENGRNKHGRGKIWYAGKAGRWEP